MKKDFYYIGQDGRKHWLTLERGSAEWVNYGCPHICWKDGSVILETNGKWEIKTWWMDLSEVKEKLLIKKIIRFIEKSDKSFVKKYNMKGGNLLNNLGYINGEKVNIQTVKRLVNGGFSLQDVEAYDNGGKTIDRYTIIIDKDVYTLSEHPFSIQGVNNYIGTIEEIKDDTYIGKKVSIEKLPKEVIKAIKDKLELYYKEGI